MMRSRVVLPDPDGPSNATSWPAGNCTDTSFSAVKDPKVLVMFLTSMLMI